MQNFLKFLSSAAEPAIDSRNDEAQRNMSFLLIFSASIHSSTALADGDDSTNRKFKFYTFLETSLVTLILLSNFISFFNEGEIPASPESLATTFLTFVLNLAFALSVLGLLVMHLSLVAANITTIEAYEQKTTPKWRYDLERRKNFEQL